MIRTQSRSRRRFEPFHTLKKDFGNNTMSSPMTPQVCSWLTKKRKLIPSFCCRLDAPHGIAFVFNLRSARLPVAAVNCVRLPALYKPPCVASNIRLDIPAVHTADRVSNFQLMGW